MVFPFENKTGNELHEWIRYAAPESFTNLLQGAPLIQVWDPVLLASIDRLDSLAASDSLLLRHQSVWEWDVAVGGSFAVRRDSVTMTMTLLTARNGTLTKNVVQQKAALSQIAQLSAILLDELLRVVKQDPLSAPVKQQWLFNHHNPAGYGAYVAGYGYEMRGDLSAAYSAYVNACALDPADYDARFRLGRLLEASGNTSVARQDFEAALVGNRRDPRIVTALAHWYLDHETRERALKFIEQNQAVLSPSADGMTVIGLSYLIAGEYQRAIAVLTKALAAGPSDLQTDYILGNTYIAAGDYALAVDVFRRLTRYRPAYWQYASFLGTAYRKAGLLMESAAVLEEACKPVDANVSFYVNLSYTYFALGWFDRAYQLLRKAQEAKPDMGPVYVGLGVVQWFLGRPDSAAAEFKQASHFSTSRQAVLNNQATMLLMQGDLKKAVELFRKADQIGTKNEVVLYNLGMAWYALKKWKAALATFDELLLLTPQRLDVLLLGAQLSETIGDHEKAKGYFRAVLDVAPSNQQALKGLVMLLAQQGKYDEAIDAVESYCRQFSNTADIRLLLADLYRRRGWYEVAQQKYQGIIADFPALAAGYLGSAKCLYDIIQFKNGKNYDEVIYILKNAAEKDPADPEADMLIGTIYMDYKHYRDLAIEHWQKALTKTSDPALKKKLTGLIAGN
ncbi:MAG: tetratricopeptide repeat protein [Chitinivibrionales bacterium]|nr:tetratricopeptide repeat protein [Chitinivibrionales bacterium]